MEDKRKIVEVEVGVGVKKRDQPAVDIEKQKSESNREDTHRPKRLPSVQRSGWC